MRNAGENQSFVLGDWRVEPANGMIVREGVEKRLEPQLMELLLLFAVNPGRVIGKDEIIATVWRGRAIGDDTMAAAISRLRAALGETKDKRYIETLSKRGYRLLMATGESAPQENAGKSAGDLVTRGFAALKSPLGFAQARLYFEQAIAGNSRDARAHQGLAETMLLQHLSAGGDGALIAAAKASAHAAVALDEHLAPAWSTLGFASLLSEHDFAAADALLLRALASDPAHAAAHRYRAFALASTARFVEAEREIRKAVEIEPLSLALRSDLAQILLLARRYAQAILETKRTLSLSPGSGEAWAEKGWAHHFLGEENEARKAFLESLKFLSADTLSRDRLFAAVGESLFAAAADLFESQQLVFRPRPTDIAILRANAGDPDAAFVALEQAVSRHDPYLLWAPHMPHLDRLKNDPRFAALMERVRPVH